LYVVGPTRHGTNFQIEKSLPPSPAYFSLTMILYKDKFAVEPQDTTVSEECGRKCVGYDHVEKTHSLSNALTFSGRIRFSLWTSSHTSGNWGPI